MGTIEGNSGGMVRRKIYSIGDGRIRGYARPHYSDTSNGTIEKPKIGGEGSIEGRHTNLKHVSEKGRFYPNQTLNVRSTPSRQGKIVA